MLQAYSVFIRVRLVHSIQISGFIHFPTYRETQDGLNEFLLHYTSSITKLIWDTIYTHGWIRVVSLIENFIYIGPYLTLFGEERSKCTIRRDDDFLLGVV